jgi:hypothetical protein
MSPYVRSAAALFTALVLLTAGCDNTPVAGESCSSPGSMYAHGDTILTCGPDGRWEK